MIIWVDLKNKIYCKRFNLDYLKFCMILKLSQWILGNFNHLSMTPGALTHKY